MSLYLILIIVFSIIFFLGIVGFIVTRSKKQDDSELGIFHHPSNFKKPPVEWVQKSEDAVTDNSTKKL